ncbi:uncharacterized protein PAN0_017d5513 [Moesziomyces antarcticus]|uniref:Uncharacterized protein n=2 Tax=Pseudozyma antarctica TaxID=84753 RepID=A0A081CKU0_PSEA2|nr:uncharacterized protein PAN0_017d5513 [Moesziomyces antarcticus]GAK67286.1 conserved hypothetical protein [Moesziomyces antarcticus]SPO48103.1 related to RLM1 - MADS-box transcription factor [Moesziomyces antarcticus]
MGRKKIKIQPIKEDRNRSVTYLKRKAGLFKKAHELAVLTDSQVAVIVFGHNGKLAEFCSTDIDLLLLRYTEYDGAAERKGPQHYFNLDKDSDDNDDNDDNDNDGPDSGDGPDDSFASQSGANGSTGARGSSSSAGNSRSTPRTSGVKRKAEPASPPRTNRANGVNPASANLDQSAFGAANPLMGASATAKQTVNAAIRQKSQSRSGGHPAAPGQLTGTHTFDPFSFGQPFVPTAGIAQGLPGAGFGGTLQLPSQPSSSGASSTNLTRAQTIANMSIAMPSNERLPIFVQPATPGFGLTPGGTVTTPGGRRFSFSDVLTRGTSATALQRPVTANSLLASTNFQPMDAFSFAATPTAAAHFASISPSVTPQPPDASLSASNADAASRMDPSPTPFSDPRSNAHLMTRPASTGMPPSGNNSFNDLGFGQPAGSTLALGPNADLHTNSPANISRPFTACANLDAPSTSAHLAPPDAFSGSLGAQGLHASSASPMPHAASVMPGAPAIMSSSYGASPYATAAAELKPSMTPLSSATPELIQPIVHAASAAVPIARASTASMSTDEETPPSTRVAAPLDGGKMGAGGAWLTSNSTMVQKPGAGASGQATLVQPVPINPIQSLGSVPFDLNFAANPPTGL